MGQTPLNRRTVLRGFGAAIALPMLEAMEPALATAADLASSPEGAATALAPKRMAFLYIPNGVNMREWTPASEGPLSELPAILKPLAHQRDNLLVLSGLGQHNAAALGDGGGDHARASASFLTGVHVKKTDGADIRTGISADQIAAMKIGRATRFPSLELGIERGLNAGGCDSGYSCAYSSNISWRSESVPAAKEVNPRVVFDRLFGSPDSTESAEGRKKRDAYQKSILDFVNEDAKKLSNRLGRGDRRKLGEYMTAIREMEILLEKSANIGDVDPPPGAVRPAGLPGNYEQHVRLMCDLIALAFQGDLTRVCTFILANDGSNRSYSNIGVPDGHHDLSHHGHNPEKLRKIKEINTFHVKQFAYLLDKLASVRETNGQTLLDNSMIVYGGGIGDGDRHNHDDLPILVAGKGGGTIKPGRHIRYRNNTPLNNLYLAMLERVGAPLDGFGDSSGPLWNLG